MLVAAAPANERERLAALHSYHLLDTPPDPRFDVFTRAAARIFDAPTSLVSLIYDDRQWSKSRFGAKRTGVPRAFAFCAHAMLAPDRPMVVEDTLLDERFADHPLVICANGIRFYAGAPLIDDDGFALGALCVIDVRPRAVPAGALATLTDLATGVVSTMALHRARIEQAAAAERDQVTGLANHAGLTARLRDALGRAPASGGGLSLICAELHGAERIDDVYGRSHRDSLLRQAARRLRSAAGPDDVAARVGAGRFALLSPDAPGPAEAMALARRVRDSLGEPFRIGGQDVPLGASAGAAVAMPGSRAPDAEALLEKAGAALHRARRSGGGPRLYTPEIGEERRAARRLERDLHAALNGDRFRLHWQPIVAADGAGPACFEALLRWDRPGHGLSGPAELIEAAESLALVREIDRWAMREACRQAAAWPRPLGVAVNVSAQWLHDGDLPALVAGVLAETGLDPGRLEIEVTERTLLEDEAHALAEFGRLRALGVRIVLDDFGSGYSSLAYLATYRFDKIKLSGVFASRIGCGACAEAVLRAVLGLCATLGLPVCAEAVETEAQLAFLRAEGCDQVQGHLTGAARPEAFFP